MNYTLLGKLNTPGDLNTLNEKQCALLCREIREELIERVTENGGHLASNLGVVELTLALHRVFDLPNDRLIFDVGHQSYVHKILSDRYDRFETLRKIGGLSGFQRRDESVYDAFGGGHASTSLSAAIGFAEADNLQKRRRFTVAVVGDGAFTGGMIHEALNNCREDLPLIIVLNENEMSISKNTGHFANLIAKLRSTKSYFWAKRQMKKFLSSTKAGKKLLRFASKQKMRIKRALYTDNYFEKMGINYFGPIDGHDQKKLEAVLREAKQSGECSLIHVRTVKGKGYEPAEKDPGRFHGIPPACHTPVPTFSEHFGKRLTSLAEKDERICGITAAMADGTGLTAFQKNHPQRFFDVGIAEEHAMTFAAGLSAAGMKPVYAVYSTFSQRCYDQMIHDAALQSIPVVLAIDRAGLAPADGPTHHGIFDVSMALSLPDSKIYAPLDFPALDALLDEALSGEKLTFIRYRSGGEIECAGQLPYIYREEFLRGKVYEDADGLIVTYGALANEALHAENAAARADKRVSVLALESLRPTKSLVTKILKLISPHTKVVFAEEGIRNGGAGVLWKEVLGEAGVCAEVLAIDRPFELSKKGETLLNTHGISKNHMLRALGIDCVPIV